MEVSVGALLALLSVAGGFAAAWIFSVRPHHLLVWLVFVAASFILLGWPSLAGVIAALVLRWPRDAPAVRARKRRGR